MPIQERNDEVDAGVEHGDMPYARKFLEKSIQGAVCGCWILRIDEKATDGTAGIVLQHVILETGTAHDGGIRLTPFVSHDPHDEHFLHGFSAHQHSGAEIAALIGRNAVETEISRRFQFGINQGVGDTPDL